MSDDDGNQAKAAGRTAKAGAKKGKGAEPAGPKAAKPRKKQPRGLVVYTEAGTVPGWITAARSVLVLALALTIPFVLGVEPGRRLFWAAAIAILPISWVTFGYHLWRRLCPLAVVAQLGRLLGHPGQRRVDAKSWLAQNYMLLQLGIMVVALSLRLTMTNGTPIALAAFLGVAVVGAAALGFFFTGKTWCNYVCPVGMVEKLYTEPARLSGPANSQCSPCTACKKNCPDIDLEQGYWKELSSSARRLCYFAWPGIVLAFYTYYYLVAGDWSYYFSGAWTLEDTQISTLLDPGLFFFHAIPIAVAAPLTLLVFGAGSLAIFHLGETWALRRTAGADADRARIRHRALALAGFTAFIIFYYFGGQPTIRMLPPFVGAGFSTAVAVAATAILVRRWRRSESDFVQEKFAEKILKKWEWGDAPESTRLQDIYLLHHERKKERDARLDAYKETVREMVADGLVTKNELALLGSLRAQLGISDQEHQRVIDQLGEEERQLFDPAYQGSVELRLQKEQYRREIVGLVRRAARSGTSPREEELELVRREHGIDIEEHRRVLAEVRGDSGPLLELVRAELGDIEVLGRAIAAAAGTRDASQSRSVALLGDLCRHRARQRLRRALAALAQIEPSIATEPLVRRLTSPDRNQRRAAVDELNPRIDASLGSQLGAAIESLWPEPESPPSSEKLSALASDISPHIRAIAAHVLSRFDDDHAREAAIRALDDESGLVREAAAYALAVRGRLRRELMAKALKDPDERVRRAAVAGMSPGSSDPNIAIARAEVAQTAAAFATLNANARIESLTTLERMALLRRVSLFTHLDPEDLEAASLLAEERIFDSGQHLCSEGEQGDEVFVIIDGALEVWTGEGQSRRVLGTATAGSCIGEMAVLDAAPRSATVTTTRPTRTLVLPAVEFRNLIVSRPAVGQAIIDVLVARLRTVISERSHA